MENDISNYSTDKTTTPLTSRERQGGGASNLKGLAKDTAIYGLSSIVGRFLNYLLVPLYTHYMPKDSGDYGASVNIYAYTALVLVFLTFGMETTLFRFANKEGEKPKSAIKEKKSKKEKKGKKDKKADGSEKP